MTFFWLKFFYWNFFDWNIVDLQCCIRFCCIAKWISCKYTYIYSILDSFPIWVITEYWVEFPVQYRSLLVICFMYSSVQFSRSVVSDSLWPHESQHARSPCPSPTPGVYSDSCPSSWWCNPAVSSSVFPFSSCPQSLPASGTFPIYM